MKLALFGLVLSFQALAAPVLRMSGRIETAGVLQSAPIEIFGVHGERIHIAVESAQPQDLLVARSETGATMGSIAVDKLTGDDRYTLLAAHLNLKHHVVAIYEVSRAPHGYHVMVADLTAGTVKEIAAQTQMVSTPYLVHSGGKDLIAVQLDTVQGNLVRVVDEATGAAVKEIPMKESIYDGFEHDRRGNLKLYSAANNVLVDVASGVVTKLIMFVSPKAHISDTRLPMGAAIQVVDGGVTTFYDKRELIDGHVTILRQYASEETEIFGNKIAVYTRDTVRLLDIQSGRPIGPEMKRNMVPLQPDDMERGRGRIADVLIDSSNSVAVLREMVEPNSYMVGSILTYIDLTNGAILRTVTQRLYSLDPEIVIDETGRLVTIEHNRYGQLDTNVVDLRSNKILAEVKTDSALIVAQTAARKIFAVWPAPEGACVAYISDVHDLTCTHEVLANTLSLYSYNFTTKKGEFSMGLTQSNRSGVERGTQFVTVE